MHPLANYEVYIFDCDGVILDSNELKIEAMRSVLETHFSTKYLIDKCVEYFQQNFGKSRFHHVAHFLDNILPIKEKQRTELEQLILTDFSKQCRSLYIKAQLTPSFMTFLKQCKGKRYVASGSEQSELKEVFVQRGLDEHFDDVFGSPTAKEELVRRIVEQGQNKKTVMLGDAMSDMLAAQKNDIDFVFYTPYSNVKEKMIEKCQLYQYLVIDDFSSVRF
jgi:phosphoglycolate phosphatase-like HAD superfamily hydrolase